MLSRKIGASKLAASCNTLNLAGCLLTEFRKMQASRITMKVGVTETPNAVIHSILIGDERKDTADNSNAITWHSVVSNQIKR